jgi:hypothetical protein
VVQLIRVVPLALISRVYGSERVIISNDEDVDIDTEEHELNRTFKFMTNNEEVLESSLVCNVILPMK